MLEKNQGIELIKSEAWKNRFLVLISNLEEILALSKEINHSISSRLSTVQEGSLVKKIVAQHKYEKEDLVAASQYYNNSHLIGFWKWYNKELEKLIHSGKINSDFPVFSISKGYFPETFIVKSHDLEFFQSFTYEKDSKRSCSYHHSPKINTTNTYKCNSYEQIIGQLHLLSDIIKQSTLFFYNKFIFEQKSSASSYFDDYRIHKFLDHFLYYLPGGQACGAPFEKIFFNNSLQELEVYLNYSNFNEPNLTQISNFLNRQRKYYMTLALNIGVEENAFLNNNRHLLYYDPSKGVVVMPELSINQYDYFHSELILKAGFIKMNGCPFAKSKGVSKNAVIEVYYRFDRLMLKLIEHWKNQQLN